MLALIALGACLVGRLHVYVGSWGTNRCFRKGEHASKPPISGGSMFVMWFSGLRGGVAFALAAVSYGNGDVRRSAARTRTPDERVGARSCYPRARARCWDSSRSGAAASTTSRSCTAATTR
jgi:hypothetical protein